MPCARRMKLKPFTQASVDLMMEYDKLSDEELDCLKAKVLDALDVANAVFDKAQVSAARPFCKHSKRSGWSQSVSPGLWDVQMHVFSGCADQCTKAQLLQRAAELREGLIDLLMVNKTYTESLSIKGISERVQATEQVVAEIMADVPGRQRRYFPLSLKKEIHDPKKKCAVCHKELGPSIDRLAGDHILPFSKGGRTDIANMQLLHRECNSRKGARVPRD